VNAVGACFPTGRELDAEAVARARLYTDRRESCLAEAGDFLLARAEGAVTDAHLLGEVGDVFLGRLSGRTSDADITLFESLGLAVEDLASAHALLQRARETGAGHWLEWGGPAGS
jgi:ornithine cyclodeaminase